METNRSTTLEIEDIDGVKVKVDGDWVLKEFEGGVDRVEVYDYDD